MDKPNNLCLAPWVHTYLSPQTERRLCCASREPAQNFEQYIDTSAGTGKYIPITLEEHWNGEHMRDVRARMLAGQTLPECEVCNDKLLNSSVYRDYFTNLFGHKWQQVLESTASDGSTTMKPVSWDYRFSNLCNFKCRTCGDKLSSSWESELKNMNAVSTDYWEQLDNLWMKPDVKRAIIAFQESAVEQEFARAVEEHRVEEVYWVGGEPLMYDQHWRYMRRVIELGDGPNVYARYNTNLSRVALRGVNLYTDILAHLRDWQICASLDGTGKIGEYIRTGLDYQAWLSNFKAGIAIQRHRRQMRIDFTLTLPGMFEVENIHRLAQELGVDVLAKVVFSFSPDISMSPLLLPQELLHPWVDEILQSIDKGPLQEMLVQLKTRPTFAEQWPTEWQAGLSKAKFTVDNLEAYRQDTYTLEHILAQRPEVLKWWQAIKYK
jgi:hypothetical protein